MGAATPRTLVFCTSYAQSPLIWQKRYRRWVDAVLALELGQRQVVLVDDGSAVLPGWPDTDVVTVRSAADVAAITSTAPVLLIRFPQMLGRADIYDFPGWYRSFGAAARYAITHGYERVVHLESDAYVISQRFRRWIMAAQSGWTTFWSEKYQFPEIAIQVIGADQLAQLDAFASLDYARLVGVTHETALPVTQVERGFSGDRFGEMEAAVPADADFCTQVPSQREPSYYWWLNGAAGPVEDAPGRLEFSFARNDSGCALLADGWSKGEATGTWMTHAFSLLHLPKLPECAAVDLVLTAVPHTRAGLLPVQRLAIQVNAQMVGDVDFPKDMIAGCEIPGSVLRRDGTDRLRLLHPDCASPSRFGVDDRRVLALMLMRLTLQPRLAACR